MTDIRLSDSSVTSSAVTLKGATAKFAWNNLIEEQPLPAYFPGTDEVVEVQHLGRVNPTINVSGYLDEDVSGTGINFSLLKSFAKSTGSIYLFDDVFATGGVKVAIKSFDINRRAADRHSNLYNYNISLIQTL